MPFHLLLLAVCIASRLSGSAAQTHSSFASHSSFADGGDTLVSAMMMFLGNEDKVYIVDKTESNAVQINGHPAWSAVWDFHTHQASTMDIRTNVFCAAGMHLPNGSFATFGGTVATGRGGRIDPANNGSFDPETKVYDGSRSIRILNPCKSSEDLADSKCQWFDDASVLSMQRKRWYAGVEPLADGTVVLIGGFVIGGFVNRNVPNIDPRTSQGGAEPTYEFYPSRGEPRDMQFLIHTSGLNAYAHTFLMASGKMFVQANYSTILWDYDANVEIPLPDMPRQIVRVYPASGAAAMLPLTPGNNYTPTILFCGGSELPPDAYGDYIGPAINTWERPASRDCQRITPEPPDGSPPVYEADDEMMTTRTMGQLIILPDGKLIVINGAEMGTAGYAEKTGQIPTLDRMPFYMSLATVPVYVPHVYDQNAPKGSRWSVAGSASTIPRMYHSTALLLPDASILIAGSNPGVDVNLTAPYPTTYKAEIFYPSYFRATTRPAPLGLPGTISYGGSSFDITIPPTSYAGNSNDAADNTIVSLIRPGFSTHSMNMGQRYLQLNNTYTVYPNGTLMLHIAQAPPNPNIFQPGPALLFVVIHGIPSHGKHVIVGSGRVGAQPTQAVSVLPSRVRDDSATGSGTTRSKAGGLNTKVTVIVVGAVGGLVLIAVLVAVCCLCMTRKRHKRVPSVVDDPYTTRNVWGGGGVASRSSRSSRSSKYSTRLPPIYNARKSPASRWESNNSSYFRS